MLYYIYKELILHLFLRSNLGAQIHITYSLTITQKVASLKSS